jgi:hypothetical protein
VKKDHKKETIEMVANYTPIGLIDDYLDPNEASGSKY